MHFARRMFAIVAPLIVPALLAAQTYPSDKDPRSGLKPGRLDAGTAALNMRPPSRGNRLRSIPRAD